MDQKPTYEELEQRIKALEKKAGKRKKLEAQLKRYKLIIDSAQDAVFFKDLESRYIMANDKTLEAFGLSKEEVIGKNDYEIMPDQIEAEKNVHGDQIVFKSGKHTEVIKHMTGADEKDYWFQAIIVPQFDDNDKVTGLFGIARDITEQKLAQKVQAAQLRLIKYAAEHTVMEFLQKFLDEAEVLTISEIGFFHFLENDQRTLMLQTWSTNTLENMCTTKGAGLHYPVSKAGVWVDCVRERRPVIHNDYASLAHKKGFPEGHAPVIRELVVPVFRGDKIVAILGVGNKQTNYDEHDVNSIQQLADLAWETVTHMRAEEALRKSEEQYRTLSEDLPAMICTFLPDSTLTYVNRAYAEYFNKHPEDLVGKPFLDFLPEDTAQNVKKTYMSLSPDRPTYTYTHEVIRNGKKVLHEWTDRAFFNAQGTIVRFQAVGFDVTERKRAEEEKVKLERQVQHAQKLESLGVLAGGIAHDFNNLLMAILGNADLALDELSPLSPARSNLKEIVKVSKRAAELAKQMLAYSGKGRFIVQSIDAGVLIKEIAHLLEVSISKKSVLKYNLAENPPTFDGDVTQISQVIMNLITNASEAIGDKSGVIALSTGVMNYDHAYLDDTNEVLLSSLDEPLCEGLYIYIEVADTGCGMDAETMEKIFDPFFTTKFTGRGLGMSAVLGIVRGHKGAIKIYSEVGKGTTFKVLFPANEQPDNSYAVRRKGEAEGKDWRGSGIVLIAEDEETVCTVCKQMLERMGFSVLTAPDGREALKVFHDHADEIVCVLLDLTMPCLDGEETFREMRRLNPGVTAILCSGYNEHDATQRFAGKGLAGFIQKPYAMAALREKLRQVLHNEHAAPQSGKGVWHENPSDK